MADEIITFGATFDASGMEGGVSAAERKFNRLQREQNQTAAGMTKIERGAKKLAASFGALFAGYMGFAGIRKAAAVMEEFETKLHEVATISGGLTGDIKQLRGELIALSTVLPQTAAELGAGAYMILSAQIKGTANVMKVLEASAKAAVAGLSDTATAVDAVTTVLNAYQMAADEAANVSDVLFKTVELGKLTFIDIAQNIGTSATTAALAGVTIEELAAAYAALTQRGYNAAEAGTSLNRMILTLTSKADEQAKAFEELGVDFSLAAVRAKGFAGVMREVYERTNGNLDLLTKMFTEIRAARAAFILGGTGIQMYERFLEDMNNAHGAAERGFETMAETASNAWKVLKNQFSAVLLEMAENIMPDVIGGMEKIAWLLNAITGRFERSNNAAMGYATAMTMAANAQRLFQTGAGPGTPQTVQVGGQTGVPTPVPFAPQQAQQQYIAEQQRLWVESLADMLWGGTSQKGKDWRHEGTALQPQRWSADYFSRQIQELSGEFLEALHLSFQRMAQGAFTRGTYPQLLEQWPELEAHRRAVVLEYQRRGEPLPEAPIAENVRFENWYKQLSMRFALQPDPAAIGQFYDFRKLFRESGLPYGPPVEQMEGLPAQYRTFGHPKLYEETERGWVSTATGEAATMQQVAENRRQYEAVMAMVGVDARPAAEAIQKRIDALKLEADTLGMTAAEAEVYALRMAGATAAEQEQARAYAARIAQYERSEGAKQAFEELEKGLQDQAATLGATTETMLRYQAAKVEALAAEAGVPWTETQKAAIDALIQGLIEAADAADKKSAADQRMAANKSAVEALQEQAKTLGLTNEQLVLYRLRVSGADAAQLQAAESAIALIQAWQKAQAQAAEQQKWAQAIEASWKRAVENVQDTLGGFYRDTLNRAFGMGPEYEAAKARIEELHGRMSDLTDAEKRELADLEAEWGSVWARMASVFEDFADRVLQVWVSMAAEMAATKSFEWLADQFGGGGKKDWKAEALNAGIDIFSQWYAFHQGGIVGQGGRMRVLDAPVVAPRMHAGGLLGADEVPIIAQRGELIVPRDKVREMAARPEGSAAPQVAVENHFHISALDGPSVAAMLRSQKGVIGRLVSEAIDESSAFRRQVRGG